PVLVERIALHVEKEIAVGGRWEESEAPARLGVEQLVDRVSGATLLELQMCLGVEALERRVGELRHLLVGRRKRELLERRDAGAIQAKRLGSPHAGDETEMVVGNPLGITPLGPATELAVRHRVGIRVDRRSSYLVKKALLDTAVVRLELRDPEAVL